MANWFISYQKEIQSKQTENSLICSNRKFSNYAGLDFDVIELIAFRGQKLTIFIHNFEEVAVLVFGR